MYICANVGRVFEAFINSPGSYTAQEFKNFQALETDAFMSVFPVFNL